METEATGGGENASPPSQSGGGAAATPLTLPFWILAVVSGILAAVMMVTTVIDVAGRYFFNNPLYGAFEVTEISMGLIVFTALPLALVRREMILVSVISDTFPRALRRFIDGLGFALGGVLLTFMSWRLWAYGERLWTFRERTLELRVPTGLIVQSMSVLAAVAALACVIAIVGLVRGAPALQHNEPVV